MTNILNSQISNNYNAIPARKISKETNGSRYIEAAKSLPKYSMEDELKKKEDFRNSYIERQNAELHKKNNKLTAKLCFVLAAITGFFLLKGKNLFNKI